MSKSDKASVYQEQAANKPQINDMISEHLEGDLKTTSLAFVEFLKSSKMSPQWYATGSFSVSYKNKRVCIIKIEDGAWQIWSYTRYDKEFDSLLANESAGLRASIVDNIIYCHSCGGCAPGEDATILGNGFVSLCRMPVIRFSNPNEEELNYAKKLVILRRSAIASNQVPKVSYIAIKKRNG